MARLWTIPETPRLRLRPFEPDDAPGLHAYRSDPEVARYQGFDASFSLEDARRLIEGQVGEVPGAPGANAQIALEAKDTGALVGDLYLGTAGADPKQAQLGFTLAPAHQGRGLATEAVTALLDHAFGTLGIHRVSALTFAANARSVALLERVGMRREAHHVESSRLDGVWADDYVYAVLRHEWRS